MQGAFNAERFDQIAAGADAGGVDKANGNAAENNGFADKIAGGAGDGGDDGTVLLQQAIEQRTFEEASLNASV